MKLNKLQKGLMGLIGVILALSLLLNILKMNTPIDKISQKGYDFFSMLKYSLIDRPANAVTDFFSAYSSLWDTRVENDELRRQMNGLAANQAQLDEANRQIAALKEQVGLQNSAVDFELIAATVMIRSQETWNNLITVDIGSKDGVEVNYAVITNKGLIGRVQTVQEDRSTVKLITSEDGLLKVSVKIEIDANTTADAILERYDSNRQAFVVKLLNSNTSITKDMRVITSGMGGVFPSGLLVGRVLEIEELSNAVGMNIYVKPAADFNQLDYVSVVKRGGSMQP